MLFGNRNELGIEISPLSPTWERRYRPEQSAWSALAIWVAGSNLTQHLTEGSDELIPAVNVPLAPIADWLVRAWPAIELEERASRFPTTARLHRALYQWGTRYPPHDLSEDDWIDSRESWWKRHFLAAGADGAELPNLALGRDDEKLLVDWRVPKLPRPAPRFVNAIDSAAMPWAEAESAVATFVAYIADWLRRDGLVDLYPWVSHNDPLRTNTPDVLEALALYTGRTASELRILTAAENTADMVSRLGLEPNSVDPAWSPVTQALRDLPPSLPQAAITVLAKVDEETRTGSASGLANLREVAADAVRNSNSPESAGHEAAKVIRSQMGFNGTPIPDMAAVVERVGVTLADVDMDLNGARMVAGYRSHGGAVAMLLRSKSTEVDWGRRFEQARALGRLLTDPMRGSALGAASSPYSSELRRRRSGAFAAELLLPEEALVKLTGGVVDRAADAEVFEHVMSRFGVGARTAAQQLWNVGLLSSTDVRDELIDAYGAPPD